MNPYQINPISGYAQAAEEFEARKRARLLQEQITNQKLQEQMQYGMGSNDPAAIREWKIYSSLSPDDQQRYLQMKRSDQIMNLGGQLAVRSPIGGIAETYPVTPKPEQMPAFKAEQKGAVAKAAAQAESEKELSERQASLPRLEQVVEQLRGLSKEATYSLPKQAIDWTAAQTGFGATKGATARTQYQSIIDNEILPLLRQTFGAQFTEREGQSLKATLGDVNKTPEEKQAVLDSFISAKMGQIETLKRQKDLYGTKPNVEGPQTYEPSGIRISTPAIPERAIRSVGGYAKDEMRFNLKKKGYSDDQIDEFMRREGYAQ